jgi:hypothetical protein
MDEEAQQAVPPAAEEAAEPDEGTNLDEVIIAEAVTEEPAPGVDSQAALKAVIEAAIYITDEPLTAEQIATAVEQPLERDSAGFSDGVCGT